MFPSILWTKEGVLTPRTHPPLPPLDPVVPFSLGLAGILAPGSGSRVEGGRGGGAKKKLRLLLCMCHE